LAQAILAQAVCPCFCESLFVFLMATPLPCVAPLGARPRAVIPRSTRRRHRARVVAVRHALCHTQQLQSILGTSATVQAAGEAADAPGPAHVFPCAGEFSVQRSLLKEPLIPGILRSPPPTPLPDHLPSMAQAKKDDDGVQEERMTMEKSNQPEVQRETEVMVPVSLLQRCLTECAEHTAAKTSARLEHKMQEAVKTAAQMEHKMQETIKDNEKSRQQLEKSASVSASMLKELEGSRNANIGLRQQLEAARKREDEQDRAMIELEIELARYTDLDEGVDSENSATSAPS